MSNPDTPRLTDEQIECKSVVDSLHDNSLNMSKAGGKSAAKAMRKAIAAIEKLEDDNKRLRTNRTQCLQIITQLRADLTARDEALEKAKHVLTCIKSDASDGLLYDQDEEDFGETLAQIEGRATQALAEIKEVSDG